jgi:hypothetical protein
MHVDAESSSYFAVRRARLPQLQREDATLGDSLDLAGSPSTA